MDAILDLPPLEVLTHRFTYNPDTGEFLYKNPIRPNRNPPGSPAGYLTERGWLRVKIGSRHYRVARVVWKMYHGEDPPKGMSIDHINRDRVDNRIENLRLCTHSENSKNKHHPHKRVPTTPNSL
jgi:hypothetical protein